MRIVVNHLTRMDAGYICVAGIDMEHGRHVRPVIDSRLSRALLLRNGGPFDIGALVDLGLTSYAGSPPEVEDHSFHPRRAAWRETVGHRFFWALLDRLAHDRLATIFGEHLQPHGRTYTVAVRSGSASLGLLRPSTLSFRRDTASGKLRLSLSDGADPVSLSLTDLRFFQSDHLTPRWEVVEQVTNRLRAGTRAIVGLGLTRPYKALGDSVHRHYLQANNIHLEDDPIWQERSL